MKIEIYHSNYPLQGTILAFCGKGEGVSTAWIVVCGLWLEVLDTALILGEEKLPTFAQLIKLEHHPVMM